jgi:hypothetical protein
MLNFNSVGLSTTGISGKQVNETLVFDCLSIHSWLFVAGITGCTVVAASQHMRQQ